MLTLPRRRRHRSHGQIIIIFALMLTTFLFGLVVAVIDLSTIYGAESKFARAAQNGAVAGAAQVDVDTFIATGQVTILPGSGPAVCRSTITQELRDPTTHQSLPNVIATCTIGNPPANGLPGNYQMTATVSRPIDLPLNFLGGVLPPFTVTQTYTALAQCGFTTPDATGCTTTP